MPVTFHHADIKYKIAKVSILKHFISQSFMEAYGKRLTCAVILCSDPYLLKINQDFLAHDYYTDIITFPLSETPKNLNAEIYISIDRVAENAKTHGAEVEVEFLRVLFHGVLHLAGHQDKTVDEQLKMRAAEDTWLEKYNAYAVGA
jgi:rRNA maturation RNase YbeY